MSEDFNLKTLIGLVRAARAFITRGDNLPEAVSEEHRQIVNTAIHAWIDRIINAHTAPPDDAPDLTIRDLLSMARACEALVVNGDGHPLPATADLVALSHAASQVLLSRVAKHPNGDLVAESAASHPISGQARALARKAREHITARAAQPKPAPEAAPAATFPAEPVPAGNPPPERVEQVIGDAFMFGPAPDKPVARIEPIAPTVEALELGPTPPAPAAQPEAGQSQPQ
jgi:hypothetical protein